jgi:hypothetical protein
VVRNEPVDMHLFEADPMAREVFQRVGCLSFCQNMQRGHPEVTRQFPLHFDGLKTKVGDLEFEVSKTSTSEAIGIPITGESVGYVLYSFHVCVWAPQIRPLRLGGFFYF